VNWGIWLFIVAILVVVMVHEAGHFSTAKFFNFKATQFFVGFGPTLFSRTKGETEYGLKALPLGGFVKIVGMRRSHRRTSRAPIRTSPAGSAPSCWPRAPPRTGPSPSSPS
jgi:membrane-associated protease RseP (regulator of RpoE activity)